MSVTHIVLFQFKDGASAESVKEICSSMLSLRHSCLHPASGAPYIKSLTGGRDNSPEGLQNGATHAFVVEFESVEHRDYYVKDDPSHRAFVQKASAIIQKAVAVDYTAGNL